MACSISVATGSNSLDESWGVVSFYYGLFSVLIAASGVVTVFALSVRVFWRRGMKP